MNERDDENYDETPSLIAQVPAILAHRRWWLIVPAAIMLVAGVIAAYALPALYTSSATLLVESADVPIDQQATGGGGEIVDERLAKIREQILSRRDLLQLMDQFGLYDTERRDQPLSEVVEKFRKSISVSPVSADLTQGGGRALIAFSVSTDYRDPVKAQEVTQSLVDRIVQIDATTSNEQAQASVRFLTQQSDELKTQLAALESALSGLKARNGVVLSNSGGMGMMPSTGGYDAQIAALQRDNANLNNQRDLVKTSPVRDSGVANAEAQLSALRSVYAETHPDVIIAKQRLAEAKKLAEANVVKIPVDSIAQQITFNNSQIAALQTAKAQDQSRSSQVFAAQARGPAVMEQAAQLQQKLDGVNAQYQQVSTRLMQAQAASRATNEQRGDRLVVIDAPNQPDTPSWPNRPLFMLGGAAAGAALGLMLVVLLELLMRPIRGADALASLAGRAPMGVVPVVSIKSDRSAKRGGIGGWFARLFSFRFRRKTVSAD
jgi:polysaccharide biosynthesis transport protein